jgi:hypothetical protein
MKTTNDGRQHKAHAEAYLRKAGYTTEPKTGGEDYLRRNGPVDIELEAAKSPSTRAPNDDQGASAEYRRHLKQFERHDDMAAEPTRNKQGEPK